MTLNETYTHTDQVDAYFWRDLRVGYDRISESSDKLLDAMVKHAVEDLAPDELKRVYELLGNSFEEVTEHLAGLITTIEHKKKLLLVLLREFQNRRKRVITTYYKEQYAPEEAFTAPVGQLLQMYLDSPMHLIHIFTTHLWESKASGFQLVLNKPMSYEKAYQSMREKGFSDDLINRLYQKSGGRNLYRVFSFHAVENERLLVLLYKQVNDVSRPNFDQAKRDREITELLFEWQIPTKTVEIKGATKTEVQAFSEWAEEVFKGVFLPVEPEVFSEFDAKDVKARLRGETEDVKASKELVVEKVTFRGSLLKNSPELTFELDNVDVWQSVKDAHMKNCLSLESIKDLKRLTVRVDETTRMIRSNVLRNGNVIFTFDDGRMDEARKNEISRLFEKRFGIPLFKQISNVQFRDGYADKVDFAMGLTIGTPPFSAFLSCGKHLTVNRP